MAKKIESRNPQLGNNILILLNNESRKLKNQIEALLCSAQFTKGSVFIANDDTDAPETIESYAKQSTVILALKYVIGKDMSVINYGENNISQYLPIYFKQDIQEDFSPYPTSTYFEVTHDGDDKKVLMDVIQTTLGMNGNGFTSHLSEGERIQKDIQIVHIPAKVNNFPAWG